MNGRLCHHLAHLAFHRYAPLVPDLLLICRSPELDRHEGTGWYLKGSPDGEKYGEPAKHTGRMGLRVDGNHDVFVELGFKVAGNAVHNHVLWASLKLDRSKADVMQVVGGFTVYFWVRMFKGPDRF